MRYIFLVTASLFSMLHNWQITIAFNLKEGHILFESFVIETLSPQ